MSLHHLLASTARQHPKTLPVDTTAFVSRICSLYPVNAPEIAAVEKLIVSAYEMHSYDIILQEWQPATEALVLLAGMACHYKIVDSSRRQMTGILVPGDFCDYGFLSSSPTGQCVMSLGRAVVGRIDLDHLSAVAELYPNIIVAVMRAAAVDRATTRELAVSLGARDALQRLAHLLCELRFRLHTVRLVEPHDQFALPVTQAEIGDALGLSTVHVNRTIQQLRRLNLIAMVQGFVAILDMPGLAAIASFDSRYLQAI
jgi:CRP-like cAMP-binding protein